MNKDRVERAKWLLNNVRHAAMATVNVDNTPHNTPYLFMKSDDLTKLYWGSNPKSVHSQNVERTGSILLCCTKPKKVVDYTSGVRMHELPKMRSSQEP